MKLISENRMFLYNYVLEYSNKFYFLFIFCQISFNSKLNNKLNNKHY